MCFTNKYLQSHKDYVSKLQNQYIKQKMSTRKGNDIYVTWKQEGSLGKTNNSRRKTEEMEGWAGRVRAKYSDKYAWNITEKTTNVYYN